MINKFNDIKIGSSVESNQIGNGLLRRRRRRRLRSRIRRKNLMRLYLSSVNGGKFIIKKLIGGNNPNKSLYNYIVNPKSLEIFSIKSKEGKNILSKYLV